MNWFPEASFMLRHLRYPLLTLLFLFFCSCNTNSEIVRGIPEKEANEIVVLLASKGIEATKSAQATTGAGGGDAIPLFTIGVPASQQTEAMALLNRNGLPRRAGPNLLQIFAASGLVSSSQEEQIRYQEGLSEQIASTIRKIDGVLDAVVQISFPQQEALLPGSEQQLQEVRASVYVKHQGVLDDPNSQLITKIKRLVAASVIGLDLDAVTVVADRSRFTDVDLHEAPELLPNEEKEYTRIWSVIVAQESASRFRTIFFILCTLILVLAAFIAWIVWKTFPTIQAAGGLNSLFTHLTPLHLNEETLSRATKKSEKEGEGEDQTYEMGGNIEENEEEEEEL
ncbi:MAG: type III secretion inner membrane ring lipoprotein SctJ [Verrucomicrobia bacterium]|nr:type III secretion inner membrane ring lipoprotein SctJ [Verrucomicrobiota bacterium]